MGTVDHSDPDYGPAWDCMNKFGGVERTLTEVLFDTDDAPRGIDIELELADMLLLAFLAGAKYGRSVIFQMG